MRRGDRSPSDGMAAHLNVTVDDGKAVKTEPSCHHVDIYPIDTKDLKDSCCVCKVCWEENKNDVPSFWRVEVVTPYADIKQRYCMEAAKNMLDRNCHSLQQFIDRIYSKYDCRLSRVNLDARMGRLDLVFLIDAEHLENCKVMFTNWKEVVNTFGSYFSPPWVQERGFTLTGHCQPAPFKPETADEGQRTGTGLGHEADAAPGNAEGTGESSKEDSVREGTDSGYDADPTATEYSERLEGGVRLDKACGPDKSRGVKHGGRKHKEGSPRQLRPSGADAEQGIGEDTKDRKKGDLPRQEASGVDDDRRVTEGARSQKESKSREDQIPMRYAGQGFQEGAGVQKEEDSPEHRIPGADADQRVREDTTGDASRVDHAPMRDAASGALEGSGIQEENAPHGSRVPKTEAEQINKRDSKKNNEGHSGEYRPSSGNAEQTTTGDAGKKTASSLHGDLVSERDAAPAGLVSADGRKEGDSPAHRATGADADQRAREDSKTREEDNPREDKATGPESSRGLKHHTKDRRESEARKHRTSKRGAAQSEQKDDETQCEMSFSEQTSSGVDDVGVTGKDSKLMKTSESPEDKVSGSHVTQVVEKSTENLSKSSLPEHQVPITAAVQVKDDVNEEYAKSDLPERRTSGYGDSHEIKETTGGQRKTDSHERQVSSTDAGQVVKETTGGQRKADSHERQVSSTDAGQVVKETTGGQRKADSHERQVSSTDAGQVVKEATGGQRKTDSHERQVSSTDAGQVVKEATGGQRKADSHERQVSSTDAGQVVKETTGGQKKADSHERQVSSTDAGQVVKETTGGQRKTDSHERQVSSTDAGQVVKETTGGQRKTDSHERQVSSTDAGQVVKETTEGDTKSCEVDHKVSSLGSAQTGTEGTEEQKEGVALPEHKLSYQASQTKEKSEGYIRSNGSDHKAPDLDIVQGETENTEQMENVAMPEDKVPHQASQVKERTEEHKKDGGAGHDVPEHNATPKDTHVFRGEKWIPFSEHKISYQVSRVKDWSEGDIRSSGPGHIIPSLHTIQGEIDTKGQMDDVPVPEDKASHQASRVKESTEGHGKGSAAGRTASGLSATQEDTHAVKGEKRVPSSEHKVSGPVSQEQESSEEHTKGSSPALKASGRYAAQGPMQHIKEQTEEDVTERTVSSDTSQVKQGTDELTKGRSLEHPPSGLSVQGAEEITENQAGGGVLECKVPSRDASQGDVDDMEEKKDGDVLEHKVASAYAVEMFRKGTGGHREGSSLSHNVSGPVAAPESEEAIGGQESCLLADSVSSYVTAKGSMAIPEEQEDGSLEHQTSETDVAEVFRRGIAEHPTVSSRTSKASCRDVAPGSSVKLKGYLPDYPGSRTDTAEVFRRGTGEHAVDTSHVNEASCHDVASGYIDSSVRHEGVSLDPPSSRTDTAQVFRRGTERQTQSSLPRDAAAGHDASPEGAETPKEEIDIHKREMSGASVPEGVEADGTVDKPDRTSKIGQSTSAPGRSSRRRLAGEGGLPAGSVQRGDTEAVRRSPGDDAAEGRTPPPQTPGITGTRDHGMDNESQPELEAPSAPDPALDAASARVANLETSVTEHSDRMRRVAMEIAGQIQVLSSQIAKHRECQDRLRQWQEREIVQTLLGQTHLPGPFHTYTLKRDTGILQPSSNFPDSRVFLPVDSIPTLEQERAAATSDVRVEQRAAQHESQRHLEDFPETISSAAFGETQTEMSAVSDSGSQLSENRQSTSALVDTTDDTDASVLIFHGTPQASEIRQDVTARTGSREAHSQSPLSSHPAPRDPDVGQYAAASTRSREAHSPPPYTPHPTSRSPPIRPDGTARSGSREGYSPPPLGSHTSHRTTDARQDTIVRMDSREGRGSVDSRSPSRTSDGKQHPAPRAHSREGHSPTPVGSHAAPRSVDARQDTTTRLDPKESHGTPPFDSHRYPRSREVRYAATSKVSSRDTHATAFDSRASPRSTDVRQDAPNITGCREAHGSPPPVCPNMPLRSQDIRQGTAATLGSREGYSTFGIHSLPMAPATRQDTTTRTDHREDQNTPPVGSDRGSRSPEFKQDTTVRVGRREERNTFPSGSPRAASPPGARQKTTAKEAGAKEAGVRETGVKETGPQETGAIETGVKEIGVKERNAPVEESHDLPRPPDVKPKTTFRQSSPSPRWQDSRSAEFDRQFHDLQREAKACLQQLGVSESDVLIMSLMHALFEENLNTPRAKTLDTVLVLDCSDSMGADGMAAMKKSALDFLGGIEDVAVERGLEENIAVIVMGNGARVIQHLTNDYEKVRHAIESQTVGGLSPLFEALCVAVAEARKIGGMVNASGCHRIPPRVILFTDGVATHETREGGHDLSPADPNVKVRVIRLVQHIDKRSSGPRPLIWVPIGKNASTEFLSTLASLCKGSGMLVEPSKIHDLCEYYLEQDAIGRVYACIKHIGNSREQAEAVIPALVENLSAEQRTRVVDAVMEKIENKGQKNEGQATDWDNIRQRPELPHVGCRVIRGPDWKWQNQDTDGAGTIINHDEDRHLVWVTWDNGTTNCYRCGFENAYDILPINNEDYPRVQMPGEMIEIGYTVVRGPDWDKQEQDGGDGQTGIVIRKRDDGKVKVRWTNSHINSYRFGKDGKYDLKIHLLTLPLSERHRVEAEAEAFASYGVPCYSDEGAVGGALEYGESGHPVWRGRQQNEEWVDFDEETSKEIEKAYMKKSRTCIMKHNDTSYRVVFSSNSARPCDRNSSMPNLEIGRFLRTS